jgi:hypothetical protein
MDNVVSLRPGELIITREMKMGAAVKTNIMKLQNTSSAVLTLLAARNEPHGMISEDDTERMLWLVKEHLDGVICSLESAVAALADG